MQEVYVARDLAFNRLVALKAPKNRSASVRFQRSAVVSARVVHPNIARTLDYFDEGHSGILIEELVAGKNLSDVLANEYQYFDPHLAAHIFHLLSRGVEAFHRVDVFHRDLKPGNVIVSCDPSFKTVKITDFGIAKLAEEEMVPAIEDGDNSITGSRTVVGALPYMAPEAIEKPKEAGLSADIWSLGALLYHLLFGQPPFGTGLSAVKRILMDDVSEGGEVIGRHKPEFKYLYSQLWALVENCLDKNPESRPSASELVARCSELCYSASDRQEGTVTDYRAGNGAWGNIMPSCGGSQGVFFHWASVYGGNPVNGQKVNFTAFPGYPKPRAFPVTLLK
tara:strand:+ start:2546 stop:3556 length:1011 start_codon:yes stop_codon:yes gene_type:complete